MVAAQPMSLREIRTELRKIPRNRRREIVNAIRAGRAVDDPRDAPLAAAWADYLDRRRQKWPRWITPRERPQGKHAWLWLAHVAFLLLSTAIALRALWTLPSPWPYVFLASILYTVAITPLTLPRTLRTYWNAPKAAAANRELAERSASAGWSSSPAFPHARSTGAPG